MVLHILSVSRSFPFVATYEASESWEELGAPSRLASMQRLADRPRDGVKHDEGRPLHLDRYAALFGEDR